MRPDFDAVIVAYDGRVTLAARSAREHHEGRYIPGVGVPFKRSGKLRITVIDNQGFSYEDSALGGDARWLTTGENLGWVKAANVGLALSTAPYVVLLNDDCEVKTDGWLEKLRSGFDGERVACVAPGSALRDGFQARGDTSTPLAPTLSLGGFGIGTFPLSFSCVMFSRPALEEIGYLDERLGHGYGGDDDDWQARAHLAGWQLAVHPGVEVTHQGGASWHGEAKAQAQAKNVKILREMWRERLIADACEVCEVCGRVFPYLPYCPACDCDT